MTITELSTAIRRKYNAVSDSFFSDEEITFLIWEACLDLARESECIEAVYSSSTVASQQEYDYPTSAIGIKRIQYAGKKLKLITMRDDDAITGSNQSTTETGTPQYYFIFKEVIYLRPLPSAVGTLKIWTFNEPQQLTTTSTLEIPTQFHMDLSNYVVSEMAAKDLNFTTAQFYLSKWEKSKIAAKRWQQKRRRSDSFASVQDEEASIETYLGTV